ncbi:MAG: ferrous iron transport protein A [Clostridia bacterium]|nr:ferrous iron transport protein A [Clostridia bacterium]
MIEQPSPKTHPHAFPLTVAAPGERVRIFSLMAGCEFQGRLASMGLFPGEEILVIRNDGRGPFLLSHKGSKIMLGPGMAQKIMVR